MAVLYTVYYSISNSGLEAAGVTDIFTQAILFRFHSENYCDMALEILNADNLTV